METVLQHPYTQAIFQWFESLNLSSMDLTLIASLIASWGALVLALSAVKRIKGQNSKTEKICEKLTRELHVASSGAIGMGQRIIAMERKMANKGSQSRASKPRLQAVPKRPKFVSLIDDAIHNTNDSQAVKDISAPQPTVASPETDNSFDTAKSLLRRGVDQAEVARRCGLSLSETALMAMVLNNREGRASRLAG